VNLQELAMDNNPLCSEKNYKRNVIGQLLSLKKFDAKRITVRNSILTKIVNFKFNA
jgi:hypothetical protein